MISDKVSHLSTLKETDVHKMDERTASYCIYKHTLIIEYRRKMQFTQK